MVHILAWSSGYPDGMPKSHLMGSQPILGETAGAAGLQSSTAQQWCLRAAHLPCRAQDGLSQGFSSSALVTFEVQHPWL